MNNVSLKPKSARSQRSLPEEQPFMLSGVVNWRLSVRPHAWQPPTDIYETETQFIVRVEIAGMNNSEFAVTVDNNTLVVRGSRPDTQERRAYHQMEIHYGEFSVEVEFPRTVDINRVEAEYKDGFLIVMLPKTEPKQITIGDQE